MLSQKELNSLLNEAIQEVGEAGIDVMEEKIMPNVRIANATSYFGQCRRRPEGYEISISKYHLTNPVNAIYQTMVHEVLHTIDGCMNHGKKWKSLANIVNNKYGYNISRVGTSKSGVILDAPPKAIVYKYIIACQGCGHEYKRQRKSKLSDNPSRFRCGKCSGKLKVV